MIVTFDSNVWQVAVAPEDYPDEKSAVDFNKLNAALQDGRLVGRVSEVTFSLEGIKKVDRLDALASYYPSLFTAETSIAGDGVKLSFSIGPDMAAHPGNNEYLKRYLQKAAGLGIRAMYCPRIGGLKNPDLERKYFVVQSEDEARSRQELAAEVVREIEGREAGMFQLRAIGLKYAPNWMAGIRVAPEHEAKAIAKAIAEWADGDSIAAHIGYGNQYYCTRDSGRSAGQKSIFSEENRNWLKERYGVSFVTPEELAALIA